MDAIAEEVLRRRHELRRAQSTVDEYYSHHVEPEVRKQRVRFEDDMSREEA